MQDYAIFVDASADLDPRFARENDIRMVSMSYTLGGENRECSELESEDALKRFYDGQRHGDLTHTSQVSPQQYMDAFAPVLAEGRDLLYISLSGGLTNSHDSVRFAAEELRERYPDASVFAVDSLSATGGIGLLAERAVENRVKGLSVEENAKDIEAARHRVCHLFMVEDLMYLKRGGRVSAATAVVGTALSIKPILVIDQDGALRVVSKQRGRKHALSELISRFERSRDADAHRVSLIHADAPELASQLESEALRLDPRTATTRGMLSPIIGAHTGPGMAAIIFFGNRDKIM